MKISKRLATIVDAAEEFCAPALKTGNYPETVLDLVIFHRMHFHMSPKKAKKCYNHLKSRFVDWNEVRVSVVRDIQVVLRGSYDSLELTVFIKDFLDLIHKERRELSLESLRENNLREIRDFLKRIKGMKPATIEIAQMRLKDHPILPLSLEMEKLLVKLRLAKKTETRDRKGKRFYSLIEPDKILPLHHYLLYHANVYHKIEEGEELPAALSLSRPKAARNSKPPTEKKTGKN